MNATEPTHMGDVTQSLILPFLNTLVKMLQNDLRVYEHNFFEADVVLLQTKL